MDLMFISRDGVSQPSRPLLKCLKWRGHSPIISSKNPVTILDKDSLHVQILNLLTQRAK